MHIINKQQCRKWSLHVNDIENENEETTTAPSEIHTKMRRNAFKRYIDDNTQLQKTANSENIKNQKQRKKGEREGGKEQRDISYIYVYTNAAIKFGVVCEFVSNTLESKKHQ